MSALGTNGTADPTGCPTPCRIYPHRVTQEAAQMLHVAECQTLPNQGATLAERQALRPSLNEALHVNYLLLLCPRPKDNAHPGARKGFLGCTPAGRKK